VTTKEVSLGSDSNKRGGIDLDAGQYVLLSVADTGCGIDEAARSRIFDQFFTTKAIGRGLGLAAVRGIVRSHGGAIDVVSAPDAGATFETLFPAIARSAEEHSVRVSAA